LWRRGDQTWRVVRVMSHAGTSKIWIVKKDGQVVTDRQFDTWEYEGEFRLKYDEVQSAASLKGEA
jgi:hypothetical protein